VKPLGCLAKVWGCMHVHVPDTSNTVLFGRGRCARACLFSLACACAPFKATAGTSMVDGFDPVYDAHSADVARGMAGVGAGEAVQQRRSRHRSRIKFEDVDAAYTVRYVLVKAQNQADLKAIVSTLVRHAWGLSNSGKAPRKAELRAAAASMGLHDTAAFAAAVRAAANTQPAIPWSWRAGL